MAVIYKRCWKLLIDKDLNKKALVEMTDISLFIINKLKCGDNVNKDVLAKNSSWGRCMSFKWCYHKKWQGNEIQYAEKSSGKYAGFRI